MESLKQRVRNFHNRWSAVKEKEREKEREEMTLCLYECLRAVGLQHHYARFTSMGVCRVAHLSALTMEDYPILGIRTMEERTRLFHLVQMVKTDLENLVCEDDDYDDYSDVGYAVVDSSYSHDRVPDEDVHDDDKDDNGAVMNNINAACLARPSCVRRRLDFSCETTEGTVHIYASHNKNDVPVQGKMSASPVQLELDNGSAAVCGSKGSKNQRADIHSHLSDHHAGGNTKTDIVGGISLYNSHSGLSSKCASFHKQKPRPATVTSRRFNNKPAGHKDRKRMSRQEKLVSSNGAKPTLVYESKKTAGYNYGLPQSSPATLIKKQAGDQRISVCVRKRPLTHAESRRGEADVVTTPGGHCVIIHESKEAVDLTQYILQHRFYFDHAFGEESTNEEVYQRTAYPLVQHMLNGGKATCFAYGQTGAGKTHTMLGSSPRRPGLYALAVCDIFAHLSTTYTHSPLLVYVSFFEIYCGQLYDLLNHRKRLFAREDGQKVVHIAGLHEVRVDSVSSLLEVISQGMGERTQGMSGVNPLSSRSHALLQIQLRRPNQQIAGRMWFVDLAGSERASDTKEPDRQSRMEGAEINQSLLALKECIRSLDQEQSHTPFRQSKLTQVLKDSIIGDSMTCMIANISPGHLATEHTLNTLRYADRVKELRRQGGAGGRRSKTLPSPKHNLSNSSRSTRGKSPPKKARLGRQREAFGPTSRTTSLPRGEAILCSTPKSSRWGDETSPRGSEGIEFEHTTPVRGWLGTVDKREGVERAVEQEVRERENERTYSHSVSCIKGRAGLVLGQPTDKEVVRKNNLSITQKESGETLKVGREKERKLIRQRQVDSSRDTCREAEMQNERYFKKADEKDKEKERHLRYYHQQLQQFIPSSASSSVHLSSPFHCSSSSSSNQVSLSSSVSPTSCSSRQQTSRLSLSAHMYRGLEEVLEEYRGRVPVRADDNKGQLPFLSGEICLQPETSSSYSNNNNEDAHGDVGEQAEARFGQDIDENEKSRSVKATNKARARNEDRRTAGIEGGERRWAWVATTETKHADRTTGAVPQTVEAHVSYDCDSQDRGEVDEEGLPASDVPADGLWNTKKGGGADSCGLISTHSNNDRNGVFNTSPFQSPLQRAPAERPFSPACEHTNALLTPNKPSDVCFESKHTRCTSNIPPLPSQKASQSVPPHSYSEKEQGFDTNAKSRQFSKAQSTTQPLTISITQVGCQKTADPFNKVCENVVCTQVHHHPEIEPKMSVLVQDETYADSLSCIMDPLSISLLEVDQQVATASFFQREQDSTSVCLQKSNIGEDTRKGEKDHFTRPELVGNVVVDEEPLVELLQSKIQCPLNSDTETAINHTEQYEHKMYNKPALSISTQQSESVLSHLNTVPSQSHTVHSHHFRDSDNSLKLNSPTDSNEQESTSNQQVRPTIHLSTLEDMNHAQWCVVRAHWEQLEEMEALCHKEGVLLCQQPEMAFREYIHKLEKIMERKAQCVHSMRAHLQPYLTPSPCSQSHNQGEHNNDSVI